MVARHRGRGTDISASSVTDVSPTPPRKVAAGSSAMFEAHNQHTGDTFQPWLSNRQGPLWRCRSLSEFRQCLDLFRDSTLSRAPLMNSTKFQWHHSMLRVVKRVSCKPCCRPLSRSRSSIFLSYSALYPLPFVSSFTASTWLLSTPRNLGVPCRRYQNQKHFISLGVPPHPKHIPVQARHHSKRHDGSLLRGSVPRTGRRPRRVCSTRTPQERPRPHHRHESLPHPGRKYGRSRRARRRRLPPRSA